MGSSPSDDDAGHSSSRPLGPGLRRWRLCPTWPNLVAFRILGLRRQKYDGVCPDPRRELASEESCGEPDGSWASLSSRRGISLRITLTADF